MTGETLPDPRMASLGPALKARRREKRLSLRDLADQTGVSFNTLSRVERGHVPDMKNFQRIVDWLGVSAETFLEPAGEASTTGAIARHLRSDRRLSPEAAQEIVKMVEEMYRNLAGVRPRVALHLRSASTFTPAAGALLTEILREMQTALEATEGL